MTILLFPLSPPYPARRNDGELMSLLKYGSWRAWEKASPFFPAHLDKTFRHLRDAFTLSPPRVGKGNSSSSFLSLLLHGASKLSPPSPVPPLLRNTGRFATIRQSRFPFFFFFPFPSFQWKRPIITYVLQHLVLLDVKLEGLGANFAFSSLSSDLGIVKIFHPPLSSPNTSRRFSPSISRSRGIIREGLFPPFLFFLSPSTTYRDRRLRNPSSFHPGSRAHSCKSLFSPPDTPKEEYLGDEFSPAFPPPIFLVIYRYLRGPPPFFFLPFARPAHKKRFLFSVQKQLFPSPSPGHALPPPSFFSRQWPATKLMVAFPSHPTQTKHAP